jgi:hypothetical protein
MPAGRPTKLTPEVQEDICRAVRAGNYLETAARRCGLAKSTLYLWLSRGAKELQRLDANPRARMRKSEAPFVAFSDAVKKAEADAETKAVATIMLAGQTQWQAMAWYLERKYHKRWGRRQRTELTGADGGPIQARGEVHAYIPDNGRGDGPGGGGDASGEQ